MANRCPPGVICIENMTIVIMMVILSVVAFYYFTYYANSRNEPSTIIINRETEDRGLQPRFNVSYSNDPRDVLLNPYMPPLKNDGWFPPDGGDPRGVPINIRTRGYDMTYRQVGLLTRVNGPETILPLMGRPLHTNRNKWQFYTMSDQNNSVKLPVSRNGRSCTNEYGCDELFNGDTIYVEGYKDAFKVTVYENQMPRYIPYL